MHRRRHCDDSIAPIHRMRRDMQAGAQCIGALPVMRGEEDPAAGETTCMRADDSALDADDDCQPISVTSRRKRRATLPMHAASCACMDSQDES